ncbi:MAG: class I SAM-dependent methyltransferase [Oligoflexia bacterium]|nr:class I SAM-dependent methyltransferase [Oligoflexia bacterium]MBF0365009.1 class I SAM-dependent methyltransferase [Oligoflexia bacterium]
MSLSLDLDSPERLNAIRTTIQKKAAVRNWYLEIYRKYQEVYELSKVTGDNSKAIAIELGSGASFCKEIIPDILYTDIIPYSNVDLVVDATKMPFENCSLRAIFMTNVLHHIPDAEAAFKEIARCLRPGGHCLIVDQFPGYHAKWICKYLHHEDYNDRVKEWSFPSQGPLSSANTALAWIIFCRDRKRFEEKFPELKIKFIRKHTPFRYWLSGGLKSWTLIPERLFPLATAIDHHLVKLLPNSASFMDIVLQRR